MNRLAAAIGLTLTAIAAPAAGSGLEHLPVRAGELKRFPIVFHGDLPPVELELSISREPNPSTGIEIAIVDERGDPRTAFFMGGPADDRPQPHLQVASRRCSQKDAFKAELELRLPSPRDSPDIRRRVQTLEFLIINDRENFAACAPVFSLGVPAAGLAGLLVFGFIGYGITTRRGSFFRCDGLRDRIQRVTWRNGPAWQKTTTHVSDLGLDRALQQALRFRRRAWAWMVGGLLHNRYREVLELIVKTHPGGHRLQFRLIPDQDLPGNPDRSRGRIFLVAGRNKVFLLASPRPGSRLAGDVLLLRHPRKTLPEAAPQQKPGRYMLEVPVGAAGLQRAGHTAGWLITCN